LQGVSIHLLVLVVLPPKKLSSSWFISFNQLKEYLSLLAENGLIQCEDEEGTHTFKATEKGIQFFKLQNKIEEVAPISFVSEKLD
jgi:predicted transcriptional regulator